MDDNVKDVLMLAITTFGAVLVAWLKVRTPDDDKGREPPPPGVPPT